MKDQNNGPAPEKGDDTKAPETSEHMVPKSRLDAEISKRREADQTLADLAEEIRQEVPEQFRGIVPEGLPPADQIKWIRKATAAGIFSGPPKDGPDAKRPGGKPPIDFDNMSPQQIMSQGYNS